MGSEMRIKNLLFICLVIGFVIALPAFVLMLFSIAIGYGLLPGILVPAVWVSGILLFIGSFLPLLEIYELNKMERNEKNISN